MAKRMLAFFFAVLLGCAHSSGQTGRYGLGLVVFEPTGLSGKAWLNRSKALDAAIGWSSLPGRHLHLHADYLFYYYPFHSDSRVDFSFYLGAGGKMIFQKHNHAWFRVPLGIDFLSKKSPLNIFFEVVPSFNFTELDFLGAIGVRYTFTP